MRRNGAAGVSGLNHLTLAVSDLERSIIFYRDLLGCELRAHWPDGAYLEAGALWLCLSLDPAARREPHVDYTHTAFDVDESGFEALEPLIRAQAPIWKDDRSEGRSLYFLDPDGHRLELHVGTLETRLARYRVDPSSNVVIP